MNGIGRGGNSRKQRQRFRREEAQKHERRKQAENFYQDEKSEKNFYERPRWTAPVMPANPITTPDCPWCGKQIKDITTAICDKDTGVPIHFDCVLSRISGMVNLETNDTVCYIGGGRFGVVHYTNPPDTRYFTIKKIVEWESKENDVEWRKPISEYFSIT